MSILSPEGQMIKELKLINEKLDALIDLAKKPKTTKAKTTPNPVKAKYDFEAVWTQYPRKLQKKEAFSVLEKLVTSDKIYSDVLNAAKHYAEFCKQQNIEKQFIKHAATFYRMDRYKDWVSSKSVRENSTSSAWSADDLDL